MIRNGHQVDLGQGLKERSFISKAARFIMVRSLASRFSLSGVTRLKCLILGEKGSISCSSLYRRLPKQAFHRRCRIKGMLGTTSTASIYWLDRFAS